MTMLTKIGNSQGVRIPKALVEQAHLNDCEIEFVVTDDGLLLKPIQKSAREGWAENIQKIQNENKGKKDPALEDEFLNLDLDKDEWQW